MSAGLWAESWGSIFPVPRRRFAGHLRKVRIASGRCDRSGNIVAARNQEARPRMPDGRAIETEMVMQRVAPAADASHELSELVSSTEMRRAPASSETRASLSLSFAWFVLCVQRRRHRLGRYVRAIGSGAGCGQSLASLQRRIPPTTPQIKQ